MSLTDTLQHAPFAPSQPSWLGYSDEQVIEAYKSRHRAEIGTEIHEWASIQINLSSKASGIREVEKGVKTHIYTKYVMPYLDQNFVPEYEDKLLKLRTDYGWELIKHIRYIPKESFVSTKDFINDSIGFRMDSEKRLYLSDNFFGTSDATMYYPNENLLRIMDLKTGSRPAKMTQVYIYAALYCHANNLNPLQTNFETRIYQNAEIRMEQPAGENINDILKNILHKNELIKKFEGGRG